MADNKVRLSQIVGTFGPGAMLDLPERSVLVLGLDHWEMFGTGTFKVIQEPRLQRLLHLRLKDDARVVGDRPPEFRTPPIDAGDPKRPSQAIKVTVFPRWFACDAIAGDLPNRRRLVRFQDLEPPKRLEYKGDDGKRRKASPIRFVCGWPMNSCCRSARRCSMGVASTGPDSTRTTAVGRIGRDKG